MTMPDDYNWDEVKDLLNVLDPKHKYDYVIDQEFVDKLTQVFFDPAKAVWSGKQIRKYTVGMPLSDTYVLSDPLAELATLAEQALERVKENVAAANRVLEEAKELGYVPIEERI